MNGNRIDLIEPKSPANNSYWLGRWERGETGWHQAEFEPALIEEFSNLTPTRVFVPFCGKSRDLKWLVSQRHEVVGVELSELACRAFFEESQISFQESKRGVFKVFQAKSLTIFQGDYFALTAEELGEIGAVYDRAALIALPEDLRARYAAHMKSLLPLDSKHAKFEFLQMLPERVPSDTQGPPFSVTEKELHSLYGDRFKIRLISREREEMREPSSSQAFECVYRLTSLGI